MTISLNTNQALQNGIRLSQTAQNGIRLSQTPKNGIRLLPDAPQNNLQDMAQAIKDSNMIQASDCTDWGWFTPGDPRSW